MRAPRILHVATMLAVATAAALLAGCGDDENPMKPSGSGGPKYATPSSPENALTNMVTAYANRDSVAYRNVLDFEYEGTSTDLTDGTSVNLFNIDEVEHIQAFARATTIVSVVFSMGPTSSWDRLPSDDVGHPEWAVIQITGSQFQLVVADINAGDLTVNSSKITHIFRFKPTPEPSSPTDTLWTLIRWEEVRAP